MALGLIRMELSDYIVAFADAVRKAQDKLNTAVDPIIISQLNFNVNVSASVTLKGNDVQLDIADTPPQEQLKVDRTDKTIFTIGATFIPQAKLTKDTR